MEFAEGFGIVSCGLVFIQPEVAGIAAYEGFVEHAAGELIEFLFFNGLGKAAADLGGFGHIVERDFTFFAFAFEAFAEGSHLAFSLDSVDGPTMYTELNP